MSTTGNYIEGLKALHKACRSLWLFDRGYVSEGRELPEGMSQKRIDEERNQREWQVFQCVRVLEKSPPPTFEQCEHPDNADVRRSPANDNLGIAYGLSVCAVCGGYELEPGDWQPGPPPIDGKDEE